MNFKKTLFIFLLLPFFAISQINVGQRTSISITSMSAKIKDLSTDEFNSVKNSTTYLIFPEQLLDYEQFKNEIKKIWTLNDVIFKTTEEYSEEK